MATLEKAEGLLEELRSASYKAAEEDHAELQKFAAEQVSKCTILNQNMSVPPSIIDMDHAYMHKHTTHLQYRCHCLLAMPRMSRSLLPACIQQCELVFCTCRALRVSCSSGM